MENPEKSTKKKKKKEKEALNLDKERAKLAAFEPRSVQTLFRTLSRNHYNLLRMIDNKSSIILTINSILISLLMGVMYLAPQEDQHIIFFGFRVLTIFCMLSMVFALIGMLPHRYIGRMFQKSDYKGSLYAGNFASLSLEEFQAEFSRIMDSGNNVYDEMIKDLYFLGKAIAVKQKLLLISFAIFMVGLISGIIYAVTNGLSPMHFN